MVNALEEQGKITLKCWLKEIHEHETNHFPVQSPEALRNRKCQVLDTMEGGSGER